MQIPPSTSLLHALSRAAEAPGAARPTPKARPATPGGVHAPVPDSARAAARAAFAALDTAPKIPSAPPTASPVAAQPTKPLPRGSVLNLIV